MPSDYKRRLVESFMQSSPLRVQLCCKFTWKHLRVTSVTTCRVGAIGRELNDTSARRGWHASPLISRAVLVCALNFSWAFYGGYGSNKCPLFMLLLFVYNSELGGIPVLVRLLDHELEEIHRSAAACLLNLSYSKSRDENKVIILFSTPCW